MSTATFDTHEFYRELVDSGLAEKTADALTKAVAKIEKAKLDELATRRDLKELEVKIAETKAELSRLTLSVGVGVGLTQLVAIFMLFLRMSGKA